MIKTLVLDKKIKDNGNKLFINVYNLMDHQRDYYREIHKDYDNISVKSILKSKDFKVILAMYNNEVVGYIDLYKEDKRRLVIKGLFIKEGIIDIEETLYQMLVLITKENNGLIRIDIEEDSIYYNLLLNIGFIIK